MPSARAHAYRLCQSLLATAHLQRWGSCGWVASLRERRPARSAFLAKHSREAAASGSSLARTALGARDRRCRASAASREQRSRERRDVPLARRSCQSAVRPESRLGRLAWLDRHEQVNARISTALARLQRVSLLSATAASTCSLDESNGESRPTRPQHPTACRSLARRFRASFQRDALRRAVGTGRHASGERQNVRPFEFRLAPRASA